jgi:uncharacterized RDD family membrane protein YckC
VNNYPNQLADVTWQTPKNIIQPQTAGFASRLIAFLVDLFLVNTGLVATTAVTVLLLRYFDFGNFFSVADEPTGLGRLVVGLMATVTFLTTYFVYPVFFWVLAGQTPGKRLMGLRVVRTDGQPFTVARAVIRALGYWLSAFPLFLGFLWILQDDRRQGWHDYLADTYVIYV